MPITKSILKLKQAIAQYPDFPKPGILFEDLNPLYKNKELLHELIEVFAHKANLLGTFDYIAGVESRGFILAASLATKLNAGFIPVRKKGKLPGELITVEYALEYGSDTLQIQNDPLLAGKKVLIVDDVFATGGTMRAAIELFRNLGVTPSIGVIMDIGISDITKLGVEQTVVLKE